MKLLIEEYPYELSAVSEVLDGLFTLQDVEQKVSVSYVGYYFNPHEKVRDVVFILPKVLIDDKGLVFGKYSPTDIIDLDNPKVEVEDIHKKFLYEFAVWIHRAIVVYNASHPKNDIVLHRQIESEGKGSRKKKSNTLLDVILSLLLFNKENQQFFTFILKNIHSGFNKINWNKTIARTSAVVQDGSSTYLNPVNKKRSINFDEELIIIFFSILHYIQETYGFKVNINFSFKLITGNAFKRYLDGYGRTRLRQIKYKYFSDTALKLWDLCYAFFDKTYQIRMNVSQSEYLLVKSFHIVFEAMIDELIGDKDIPKGLKEQSDGKLVDHFYTYEGLLINQKADNDIYYIGDSKYYKIGNSVGKESIYKQRTYARNVIQWNLDILNSHDKVDKNNRFESIKLFDETTEGYNIIPNFFISAAIDTTKLSYDRDELKKHDTDYDLSFQIKNRLYDRDTLLLSHYDVNFLYVLSLYARDNAGAKAKWREGVRVKFREAVQEMLRTKFDFYALASHPDVDAEAYFKSHFQETLGKTFRPFDNKGIFSLALDKQYPDDNSKLIQRLRENFFVIDCPPGTNPEVKIKEKENSFGDHKSTDHEGLVFVVYIPADERDNYKNNDAKIYRSRSLPKGNIQEISYLAPMIDGYINGYYDVTGIAVSISKKDDKPRVTFSLGDFHKLGEDLALVKRNGMYLLNYGGKPIPLHKLKQTYEEAPKVIRMEYKEQ